MKTETRKEKREVYRKTYLCKYCDFNSEIESDIKEHVETHWVLKRLSLSLDYVEKFITKNVEVEFTIYVCETCEFSSCYRFFTVDHEISHLPYKKYNNTFFYYCGAEKDVSLFKYGRVGEWYYWDEDYGYRTLEFKISNLEKELEELKKIRDEV